MCIKKKKKKGFCFYNCQAICIRSLLVCRGFISCWQIRALFCCGKNLLKGKITSVSFLHNDVRRVCGEMDGNRSELNFPSVQGTIPAFFFFFIFIG